MSNGRPSRNSITARCARIPYFTSGFLLVLYRRYPIPRFFVLAFVISQPRNGKKSGSNAIGRLSKPVFKALPMRTETVTSGLSALDRQQLLRYAQLFYIPSTSHRKTYLREHAYGRHLTSSRSHIEKTHADKRIYARRSFLIPIPNPSFRGDRATFGPFGDDCHQLVKLLKAFITLRNFANNLVMDC